jgi:hypothetical protein
VRKRVDNKKTEIENNKWHQATIGADINHTLFGDLSSIIIAQWPRGTPEKRPMRDTSKPANGLRQDKVVITHGRTLRQGKTSEGRLPSAMLTAPGRRIWLRRDATRAPTQRPECVGGAEPPPRHSGGKAINPGSARAEPSHASSYSHRSAGNGRFRAPALGAALEHVPMM